MKKSEFLYVKEVAKEKSFSVASKKMGISQPALSAYINKLEKKLGVLLFDRSISPIELTEYGKYYLEYADTVMEASEKFENIISDLSEFKTGKITIGSTACFSMGYLPKAIALFHSKYEGISFDIVEGKVPDMLNKCFEGEVDIVLSDEDIVNELFDKEVLFEERIMMAVPANSPIYEKIKEYAIPAEEIINGNFNSDKYESLDISQVKNENFLLLNEDQPVRGIVNEIFKRAGFEPNEFIKISQTTTGLAMTIAGLGISFVTESTIKYSNLEQHPFYYKVGTKENTSRKMCIAYKKNKYMSKAGREFIEQLKEIFRQ